MRKCIVLVNGINAGSLVETDNPREYIFQYLDTYIDRSLPPISLSMPLRKEAYRSRFLFPYFSNLLSEGENRELQASLHHLDYEDDFGILLTTAQFDTVGAVTVKPITA